MNEILKTILPTAATMLGGPAAGFAVKFLADKLGLPESTQEAVTSALSNMTTTAEERVKLAQIDAELRIKATDSGIELRKLEIQETQVYVTDTADARAKHAGDRGVYWLGIAVLATFFTVMMVCLYGAYQIVSGGISIKDVSVVAAISSFIGTIVGYVAANAQQVISYFFGSSRGSNDKTSAMANAVKGLGTIKRQ